MRPESSRFLCVSGSVPGGMVTVDPDRKRGVYRQARHDHGTPHLGPDPAARSDAAIRLYGAVTSATTEARLSEKRHGSFSCPTHSPTTAACSACRRTQDSGHSHRRCADRNDASSARSASAGPPGSRLRGYGRNRMLRVEPQRPYFGCGAAYLPEETCYPSGAAWETTLCVLARGPCLAKGRKGNHRAVFVPPERR